MPFVRLMGIVPLGIGMTVLGFLWLTPFHEFGSPPLFFRIFGSFVALAFVLQGLALMTGAITDPRRIKEWASQLRDFSRDVGASRGAGQTVDDGLGYQCRHCGAPLDSSADVSPQGDVKCSHCGKWFNVHGR